MSNKSNWAIVIGINEYWNPRANLYGAVSDAMAMVEWLTSEKGGNVPARQLFLLTHPFPPPSDKPLPPLMNKRDATKGDLIETINQLIDKSEGQGERLFFYFSGHGLFNEEQALVMADFSTSRPDNAISFNSIRDFFANTGFAEQFFFIDACRNMLDWTTPFRVADFPFPGVPDAARLQNVSQSSLFATTPLLRAVEMGERGAFTGVLLDGLRGAGKAKIYDSETDAYLLRIDRLFSYVQNKVDEKKILVTEPPAAPLYQKVYKEFKGVGDSPVLVRMSRDEVSPEHLELYIMPEGIWSGTDVKVRVTSQDSDYNQEIVPVKGVPIELPSPLLPMLYTVRAEARGYKPESRRWAFDLYEPKRFDIHLLPDETANNAFPSRMNTTSDDEGLESDAQSTEETHESDAEMSPDTSGMTAGGNIKLFIGNIPSNVSSDDLQQLFAQSGTVESASIVEDRETGHSRGTGFVEMSSREEGEAAIQLFNGKKIGGRALIVNEAQTRDARSEVGREKGAGGSGWRGARDKNPRDGDQPRRMDSAPKSQTAKLTVKSADPLAPIEITDNKGAIKVTGMGRVVAESLTPGFYRARLVTPEGAVAEEVLDLEAGESEVVSLDAPRLPNEGLFQQIVDRGDFRTGKDGTLAVSDEVGPMATPQLTTMLALAGSIAVKHYGWGEDVTDVGLTSFSELVRGTVSSGLRVVFADEISSLGGRQDYLPQLGVSFRSQNGNSPWDTAQPETPNLSQTFLGIADYAREAEPGSYVLELSLPGRPPINISVALLPRRLTLLILHRRSDGAPRLYCYSPSLGGDEYPPEAATNLRRLELLQRFYMADQLNELHALRNAVELLHAKWLDPLAGCLGGYTMLKLGQGRELSEAVKNMLMKYEGLSDSHVLAAEYYLSPREAGSNEKAEKSLRRALDIGLPVFSDGLVRLASGIERFNILHPRAHLVRAALNKRVPQHLWTAWTEA